MKRKKYNFLSIRLLILLTLCGSLLSGCSSDGVLSGKNYLKERGDSAIDIISEAKYNYDMVVYTGSNVDMEDSIKDDDGNVYYKAISGEIATFNFEDLNKHLTAYFGEDFIHSILYKNIYANEKGEIYTSGNDGDSGIDYIDYNVKEVENDLILYKVTVFYNEAWNGKNPNVFEIDQKVENENWVFTDDKDFKWGKSPTS